MEKAILFDEETTRKPLPGAPTIDKRCSVVHRGVSHDGRFVGGGAHDRNRMVTQGVETAVSHDGRFVSGGACDRNRMVTQGAETAI